MQFLTEIIYMCETKIIYYLCPCLEYELLRKYITLKDIQNQKVINQRQAYLFRKGIKKKRCRQKCSKRSHPERTLTMTTIYSHYFYEIFRWQGKYVYPSAWFTEVGLFLKHFKFQKYFSYTYNVKKNGNFRGLLKCYRFVICSQARYFVILCHVILTPGNITF